MPFLIASKVLSFIHVKS